MGSAVSTFELFIYIKESIKEAVLNVPNVVRPPKPLRWTRSELGIMAGLSVQDLYVARGLLKPPDSIYN